MWRILVHPYVGCKRWWVWAAFRTETDCYDYYRKLCADNPTWDMKIGRPYVRKIK